MAKKLEPGACYAYRRTDAVAINYTLDREAYELLKGYAPGKKAGSFIARLVYEHRARQEERQRLKDAQVCEPA